MAQKATTMDVAYAKQVEIAAFRQALGYSDGATAAVHLNTLIAMGEKNWTDTLAVLYYNMGYYAQCNQVCNILNQDAPRVLEMQAYCRKSLNMPLLAVDSFSKLVKLTKSKVHAYELASLQLQLQRYLEFDGTIAMAEKFDNGKDAFISLSSGSDNQSQKVPVNVALLHLQAYKAVTLKEYDKAISIYNTALTQFPDFTLAKNNIVEIKKIMEQAKNK
ncbi:MAG: hypothetical protein WCO63_13850 [Bacteroidota bacterium]